MGRARGRHAAVAAGLLALVVAGAAAVALKDRAVEEWWLFRLGWKDPEVRKDAREKLVAARSARAIPRLFRILDDTNRNEVFDAVWVIGGDEGLALALGDPSPAVRRWGAVFLSRKPEARNHIRRLFRLLADEDTSARSAAADYFLSIKGQDRQALETLLAIAGEEAPLEVRSVVLQGLARAGGEEALPLLTRLITEGTSDAREAAARAFRELKARGAPAVPALAELVRAPEEGPRFHAVVALGWIGPEAAAAVPVLIEAVRQGSPAVRLAAIQTLGKMGPAAAGAEKALEEAVESEEGDLLEAAVNTLELIRK
jgi:HEAT repeat protein